ncbi:MAG: BrnA antitoxin family protein [Candidatus Korobacteraceae bacterium]
MRRRAKTADRVPAAARSLTGKQRRELAAIAALPDEKIDTSDIPELPASAWKDAVRGRFYRPVKQAVSLRLDADVVAWLKKPGRGYQTRANHILRERMLADLRKMRA